MILTLAHLQRGLIALVFVVAVSWSVFWWRSGNETVAVIGGLSIAFWYVGVLGLEFALLVWHRGCDPTPPATWRQLLRAWIEESVVDWRVFVWRQPFRAAARPDVLGPLGRRGVVFVHGYLCNRGFWLPWLKRYAARGVPYCAVSMAPVFGRLETYVSQLDAAVARMEAATAQAPLLVCHSMGGLIARAWLAADPQRAQRVRRVITIGTPHQGTRLARLSRTANALDMRSDSQWLLRLALRETEHADNRGRFTCFYSNADNIVMPPMAGALPGADNRHLPGVPHVALAFHPDVVREVDRWLESSEPC